MTVSHAPTAAFISHHRLDLSDVASLFDLFAQVPDPRDPRGVRHRLATVLTLAVLAMLCGASNFRQVADRIAELPQAMLAAAGARVHVVFRLRLMPRRDTVRRLIEAIDAQAVDLLVCRWLAARTPDAAAGVGLALDGKTVRNSGGGGVRWVSASGRGRLGTTVSATGGIARCVSVPRMAGRCGRCCGTRS